MDFMGFYTGKIFDAYEWLGCRYENGKTSFRTFAPQAQKVELLIDGRIVEMQRAHNGQFFEAILSDVHCGSRYEYRIHSRGKYVDHCDPYGYYMERRPDHKSIVWDLKSYRFTDDDWMKRRSDMKNKPLNIYEIHAGSFKKPGEQPDAWYNYEELGNVLIPYLKECGYNYVEFMPLGEHPCDESWGYQTTGYFAPTSRYGNPTQLMKLIDMLHKNNIGAIIDFVPVHFAIDSYGLAQYDGSCLYEYPSNDVGMSEWGSCNFMHSRGEVRTFLQSNANYWLKEYHFDGIRMDAISRIIYWQGDERRGVNSQAVDFVKTMNDGLKKINHGCMTIAEDSTSFKGITGDTQKGGLGFDYKWDLGWMHDTLDYFALSPEDRKKAYHKLTFSMLYFKDENYLLPFSHDEVVHGKGTILNKIYGNYDEKLCQAKALYMYMLMHPGKQLNFMGNELAQEREWDEKKQQDWYLLGRDKQRMFHEYIKRLNHIYLNDTAMSEDDYKPEGFEWADCHQEDKLIYAIIRRSKKSTLLAIFNLNNVTQNYSLKLEKAKKFDTLLCSDWGSCGGWTPDGKSFFNLSGGYLSGNMPPYSATLMKLYE